MLPAGFINYNTSEKNSIRPLRPIIAPAIAKDKEIINASKLGITDENTISVTSAITNNIMPILSFFKLFLILISTFNSRL